MVIYLIGNENIKKTSLTRKENHMKCIQKSLGILSPSYQIENFCVPIQTLFIDIETTGLYAKSSNLYMIGCAYLSDIDGPAHWRSIQWFATNYDDEYNVLDAFVKFAANYRFFIHFNGNSFDIPYLQSKIEHYRLELDFNRFEGIDIYRRIAPYKNFLKLPNCKQKTLEDFLNTTHREDKYTGGELIEIYHDYVLTHNESSEQLLLLHNEEDIKGMLEIVSALAIPDLFHLPVKVTRVQANYYKDINEKQCPEIKYFYSNYKDYYYLPKEDIAVHKSVSAFVDKAYREQATAHNCYTRKASSYLPQWDAVFVPFFKRSYDDKALFFELTDELKTQREAFNLYAHHILQMMGAGRQTTSSKQQQ